MIDLFLDPLTLIERGKQQSALGRLSESDRKEFIDFLEAEIDHTCTASAYGLERVKALENKITILKGLKCT